MDILVYIINMRELDLQHLSAKVKHKHLRNKKNVRMKRTILRADLMTVLKSATFDHKSSRLSKYTSG